MYALSSQRRQHEGNENVISGRCGQIYSGSGPRGFFYHLNRICLTVFIQAYKNFKAYTALSSVSLVVQADSNFTSSDNSTYLRKSTEIGGTDVVVPIFSLVVNLDNGKITGTSWDNGCWDCTSLCYLDKISSSTSQSICRINPCNLSDSSGTTACDPKIYVTWIGTDSSGNHMNSAGNSN